MNVCIFSQHWFGTGWWQCSLELCFSLFGYYGQQINEYKDHMIAKHDDEILVNGKSFASRMRTEVVVKEKVEQDGLGWPVKFN